MKVFLDINETLEAAAFPTIILTQDSKGLHVLGEGFPANDAGAELVGEILRDAGKGILHQLKQKRVDASLDPLESAAFRALDENPPGENVTRVETTDELGRAVIQGLRVMQGFERRYDAVVRNSSDPALLEASVRYAAGLATEADMKLIKDSLASEARQNEISDLVHNARIVGTSTPGQRPAFKPEALS